MNKEHLLHVLEILPLMERILAHLFFMGLMVTGFTLFVYGGIGLVLHLWAGSAWPAKESEEADSAFCGPETSWPVEDAPAANADTALSSAFRCDPSSRPRSGP